MVCLKTFLNRLDTFWYKDSSEKLCRTFYHTIISNHNLKWLLTLSPYCSSLATLVFFFLFTKACKEAYLVSKRMIIGCTQMSRHLLELTINIVKLHKAYVEIFCFNFVHFFCNFFSNISKTYKINFSDLGGLSFFSFLDYGKINIYWDLEQGETNKSK